MTLKGEHAVILVYSTAYAIRGERVLHQAGIESKMIPVPRRFSSNCGVCLRIKRSDVDAARQALEQAGLEIEGIYDY